MSNRRKSNTAVPQNQIVNLLQTIQDRDTEIIEKSELIEKLKAENALKSETIENLKQSLTKVNGENQAFKKRFYTPSKCGQFLELPKTTEPAKQSCISNRLFTIIFIILFFAALFILNLATFLNTDLIIKFMSR